MACTEAKKATLASSWVYGPRLPLLTIFPGCFVVTDVLSLQTFSRYGRFVIRRFVGEPRCINIADEFGIFS
jgi:hypothetical protein